MMRGAVSGACLCLLLLPVILSGCAGKPSGEILDYARGMEAWWNGPPLLGIPKRGDSDKLSGMSAPPQMADAHALLWSTAQSLVIADEEVKRQEERALQQYERAGRDEIPACANRSVYLLPYDLDQSCDQASAAEGAFFQAEMTWSRSLAKACHLSYPDAQVVPRATIAECLGNRR